MLSHAKDRAPGAVRDVGPPEVLLLLVVSMAGGLMPAAAAVVGGLLPAATVVPGEVLPAGAGVVGVPTACVSVRAALCACAGCCMAAIMLAYMPAVLSSVAFCRLPALRAPPPIELAVEASSSDLSPLSAADIRNVCARGGGRGRGQVPEVACPALAARCRRGRGGGKTRQKRGADQAPRLVPNID